jgi:hypothetical protein
LPKARGDQDKDNTGRWSYPARGIYLRTNYSIFRQIHVRPLKGLGACNQKRSECSESSINLLLGLSIIYFALGNDEYKQLSIPLPKWNTKCKVMTLWCRLLAENLTAAEVVKKFHAS